MMDLIQKKILPWGNVFLLLFSFQLAFSQSDATKAPVSIVIHGGAGNFGPEDLPDERAILYKEKLEVALQTGYDILTDGGTSIDAVVETIKVMEDSPLFNAGKGAVHNEVGKYELDASIMSGKDLNAGAVSGIQHIKNPIELARLVMNESWHVMLYGVGAEEFAKDFDLEVVENEYFRREPKKKTDDDNAKRDMSKHGTVGVVALDQEGNITAGTSTGGLQNKKYGRIGDSPIIGAGTYANNETCGISSTGIGEYFIRGVIAHDISALMEYKNLSLEEAANEVIMNKLPEMGGSGGIIGLDKHGNAVMVFNTTGMFRAFIDKEGIAQVLFFN